MKSHIIAIVALLGSINAVQLGSELVTAMSEDNMQLGLADSDILAEDFDDEDLAEQGAMRNCGKSCQRRRDDGKKAARKAQEKESEGLRKARAAR